MRMFFNLVSNEYLFLFVVSVTNREYLLIVIEYCGMSMKTHLRTLHSQSNSCHINLICHINLVIINQYHHCLKFRYDKMGLIYGV
jgi:hypothetical protein